MGSGSTSGSHWPATPRSEGAAGGGYRSAERGSNGGVRAASGCGEYDGATGGAGSQGALTGSGLPPTRSSSEKPRGGPTVSSGLVRPGRGDLRTSGAQARDGRRAGRPRCDVRGCRVRGGEGPGRAQRGGARRPRRGRRAVRPAGRRVVLRRACRGKAVGRGARRPARAEGRVGARPGCAGRRRPVVGAHAVVARGRARRVRARVPADEVRGRGAEPVGARRAGAAHAATAERVRARGALGSVRADGVRTGDVAREACARRVAEPVRAGRARRVACPVETRRVRTGGAFGPVRAAGKARGGRGTEPVRPGRARCAARAVQAERVRARSPARPVHGRGRTQRGRAGMTRARSPA